MMLYGILQTWTSRCPCCGGACNMTTTSNYCSNNYFGGRDTVVVVDYVEPPLIPPMKIPEGALKSWRIWMGWARALPRYRCSFFRPQMRRQKVTRGRTYARKRGHAFGHSPRRRSIGG